MRNSAFAVALVMALGSLGSAQSTLTAAAVQKPALQVTVLVVKGMT